VCGVGEEVHGLFDLVQDTSRIDPSKCAGVWSESDNCFGADHGELWVCDNSTKLVQ
jgi:hypothetical protein